MEDELLFETPNGSVITESEAKSKYGNRLQGLLDSGTFKQTDKPADKKEETKKEVEVTFDVEAFYISPNGSEISGQDVVKKYGERSQSLVDGGTLKKKEASVDSTGETENTGGITPILETEGILSDSGDPTENFQKVNNVVVDGVPFVELSTEEQQNYIDSLKQNDEDEPRLSGQNDMFGQPMNAEGSSDFKTMSSYDFNDGDVLQSYVNFNSKKRIPGHRDNLKITIKEDGTVIGRRKIGSGLLAKNAPRERNLLNKLFYSEEDLDEIDAKGTISKDLLDKVDVDLSDYQAWESENTKEDDFVYSEIRDLINSDEDEQLLIDKRNFQKLSAYTNSLGDDIQNDIDLIGDRLKFESNPESRVILLAKQKALKQAQVKNIGRQYNFLSLFPTLQKQDDVKKLRRKEYIMNQRSGDFSGATSNMVLTAVDSGLKFAGGLLSSIPSWIEQGGNLAGLDMSGARGLNESLDAMLNSEIGTFDGAIDTSPVERAAFNEVKEVTINWQGKPMQVGLTPQGDIVDMNTMVSMGGLLTNEQVKEVNNSAKNIPEFEITATGGSVLQGGTGMIVNLIGLIKGGQWATKSINKALKSTGRKVKGGVGMAAVSYGSSVATEVNSIKSQLMQAGLSEDEAMDRAILYGNGRASLDGLFSGLAGGNTKLLTANKNAAATLKDLILKPKTVFKSEVFKQKVKDLGKENFKEVVIEELPVLYSGAFLNRLANESIGKEILDQEVSKASVYETVLLTLGATSGLGARTLLTNNGRKDLLKAATESSNIEKDIADAVNNGSITEAEGKSVYTEIYNMQTGINQTQGTMLVSSNIEPAAALLSQRQKLMAKRAELEGPLKLEIDKKIEGVDSQIDALKKKDTAEAKAIMNQQKEGTVTTTVTKEEALASLKAENEVREKAGLPVVLESEENILKEQDNLIKEKTDAIQSKSDTETDVFVEQTITVEEVPTIYGPEVVTHKTRSRAAIENWVNGGQIVGRVENLDGFVEGISSNKSIFQVNRDNRQTPNFQQGGIYGNTLKKNEGGYVVISKPGTVDAKNFQPNLSFVNKESSKDSRGVLIPKPNTPARDISNYDIYKVVDGKMIKQNPNKFKTNKDAVQKSETEEQVLSDDGGSKETREADNVELQGMGKGDARKTTVADEKTLTPEQQAKSDQLNENRDQKIEEESRRFVVPGTKTQVQMNADGTANPVAVKENTDKPVSRGRQLKANKMILEDVIDVNEGTRLDLDASTNLTETEYSQEVADKSNNIKEIAETLAIERKNRKNLTKAEREQEADPLDIKGKIGKITEAEFVSIQGTAPTPQMKRFWFKKKNRFGQDPKPKLDTDVKKLDGYNQDNEKELMQKVIDFIIANPTGKLNIESGISNVETSLENKFEQLTGLKATPINIETVNNIDPNREPISVTKKKGKDISQKEASEPGVFGKKKSPSPDKILGKKKTSSDKTKEEGENVNRKKFWKSWNKAYRESKTDQNTRRKQLSDAIQDLLTSKTITTKKAKALIKKISGVNLNNPRLVSQVLEYVTKVSMDAANAKKFDDAKNLSNKIKKLLKSESLDAEVSIAAKQFNKIDPNLVSDLDLYLDNAQRIVNGLTKTKTDKEGNLIFAGTVDIKAIDKYTSETIIQEAKTISDAEAKAFSDLTGLDPSEFSIAEMRSILEETGSKELDQTNEQKANEKNDKITKAVKKAFAFYKKSINDIIKNSIDPISGEPLIVSKADQKVIKDFMEVDIDLMTTAKEKLEALDAMVNFIVNQGSGGMVATTKRNEGMKNVIKANKLLKPARKLKLFGSEKVANFWYKKLGATPRIIENLFKGTSTARIFNRLSGFDGFRNGVAKAETLANDIAQSYVDKFIKPTSRINAVKGTTKTQPNGTDFNTAANDTERGLFAFMRRTVDGTKEEQQNEFERRKGLIEETITTLNESGETKKSQLIKDAADKILSGSNSVQDIENKVDPINREAVEWMSAEWSQIRPELENVSLNVYNKVLGKDINYTPDSFSSLKDEVSSVDQEIGNPQFKGTSQKIYDKESGVLMDVVRPKSLPAGRVINLGFDSSNISNLKDALTDLETAESIQIMKGFLGTSKNMNPAFKNLIPDVDNRNLIFSKFQNYVNAKRGASEKIQDKETIKFLNQIAGIGVSRVLGGPTQLLKQLTPLVNTATNLMFDLGSVGKGISLITRNPDARIWLSKSGYEIANRGLQSITNLEGTNTKLDKSAERKRDKFGRAILEANKFYLEKFLVNPDRFAAQASWMAYYMNDLKKQGIDPSNIDWSNHKVNKKAGAFAEQQVGRQQNVSDTDLQGDLFKSKDPVTQVIRKTIFPFANFLINQKTRMYTDFNIALSKTATKDDKRNAYRSLAGLGVETATFNLLGLAITQVLAAISQGFTGDDDEEDKNKALQNRLKGRAGNIVKDILSPIPPLDDLTLMMVNKVIKTASDGDDPFQFFAKDKKTFIEQAGVLGIPFATAGDLFEMIGIGSTGTYTDNYGKEREIDPSLKGAATLNGLAYFLYSLGILPSEAGTIIKYNVKSYKKSGNKKKKDDSGIPIKRKTKTKTKTNRKRKTNSGGPLLGGKKKSGGRLF